MDNLEPQSNLDSVQRSVARHCSVPYMERIVLCPPEILSTGIVSVDAALSVGGWPRGHICEIFGPEGSGKTSLAMFTIAKLQKAGGLAVYIDAEHRLALHQVHSAEVDPRDLLIYRPVSAEKAFDIAHAVLRGPRIDLLVIDTVAALVPQRELDADASFSDRGLAGLIGRGIRKMAILASRSNTAVLLLNQVRRNVEAVFSNPMTTPCGYALRHHSSIRTSVRRIPREDGVKSGTTTIRVEVIKNSVGLSKGSADFDIGGEPPALA